MNRYALLLALLASAPAQAWDWDCAHSRELTATLDLDGSERLAVEAAAGELRITGHADLDEARVIGKVCVSKEEWLDEAEIVTDSGREARITTQLPDTSGFSVMGNRYAYMHLEIEVPDAIALEVHDSSGDVEIERTGALSIRDSSGDIDITGTKGPVTVEDSSGDIDLRDIGGDVLVRQDSSGDIRGRGIEGSVRVERDSSGEIRFEDVKGDFIVERDSSGDIVAEGVGGDFRVEADGSGDIRMSAVSGEVDIPKGS
jgi:hypothetical protein